MVDSDEPQATETENQETAEGVEHEQADAGAADGTGWPALAAYCDLLRAEHAAWSERVGAVETQLAALRPALLGIAAQHRALAVEDDLDQLNRMILGGAAMAQSLRSAFDLERIIALVWPAAADPRPVLAREDVEGEYRVEVFLHVGPDGRGRVRVEGAKRLEAPLPTSRERLRAVLLGAIQAPKFVGGEMEDGEIGGVSASNGEAAASAEPERGPRTPPDEEKDDEGPVESATPRPGDPDDQPPPEEQVIPLGPAAEPEEKREEKPKARRKAKA